MTAYVCVGISSPFTQWCDRLIAQLVATSGVPAEIAFAATLEHLAHIALQTEAPHVVVGVRQMTPSFQAALEQSGRRFVVVLDNPIAAFGNLRGNAGMDLARDTRAIASGCAAMLRLSALPGALRLHALGHSRDPLATAKEIVEWFGLRVAAKTLAAIVGRLPLPAITSAEIDPELGLSAFDPSERAIIAGAVGGYIDWFAGKGIGRLTWARELFFHGDRPDQSVSETVELTGRVRYLFFGPYIALPPGAWMASVSLAFSKEAAGLSYGIEVIAGTAAQLAKMTLRPEVAGVFETSAVFTISDQTDQPISLRVTNERAAIDGQLALARVTMTPIHIETGEIPPHISAALGL